MTYTGRPQITVARDLPAAVHPSIDIWFRTATGEEAIVTAATHTDDTVTITVEHPRWPQPATIETITRNADDRVSTRIY